MSVYNLKTNFTSGQLSSNLYGRCDLGIYSNGAKKLENLFIAPTGGVSRRAGFQYVDTLNSAGRLISFEFNAKQTYLIVLTDYMAHIYKEDTLLCALQTPWSYEQIKQLNWTQSADTLLLVHEDVPPQEISRNADGTWSINPWTFYTTTEQKFCPYFNFYQNKVSLNLATDGDVNHVTISASEDIFSEQYVGIRLRINGGEFLINQFVDAKHVKAVTQKGASGSNTTTDWQEEVFSAVRGYPRSVVFHQNRMVIGGSKQLPNRLWMSKTSDLFNFDMGSGLDDEAIEFAVLSDQVNAIVNLVSARHLLVFTSGAEWMVSAETLTPTNIKLNMQTKIGSYIPYNITPANANGATLFITKTGKQLREFVFEDIEQAYSASDLTLLSENILQNPTDMCFDAQNNLIYVVLSDGSIANLTTYRSEEVKAWSSTTTNGKFLSVAIVGGNTYCLTERQGQYFLEKMSSDFYTDCSSVFSSSEAKINWNNLDIYNNKSVQVVADGFYVGQFKITDGNLLLADPAKEIKIGLPYHHVVQPLPFVTGGGGGIYSPKAYRVVKATFRVLDTQIFSVKMGKHFIDIPLNNISQENKLDGPVKFYTGDIEYTGLGWTRNLKDNAWEIKSSVPYSFNLLSVNLMAEVK